MNQSPTSPAESRRRATRAAREQWSKAPPHVRLMAAAYVEPLLSCLEGIGAELDALAADVESLAQGANHAAA